MERTKVLISTTEGHVNMILTEPDEVDVFFLSWERINAQDAAYVGKLLDDAEDWPVLWREMVGFPQVIEQAQRMGIKIPEWVVKDRNRLLLQTLKEISEV